MNIFNTRLHILAEKLGDSALKKNLDTTQASSESSLSMPDRSQKSSCRVLLALGESLFLVAFLSIVFSMGCSKSNKQEQKQSNLAQKKEHFFLANKDFDKPTKRTIRIFNNKNI